MANRTTPTAPRWLGWALIALAVAFVAQSAWQQYQNTEAERDRAESLECLSSWAVRFGEALDARTSTTGEQTRAEQARYRAVDAVLLKVLHGLRAGQFDIDPAELRDTLARFDSARRRLEQAQATTVNTREQHPYPDPPDNCL